MSRPQDIRYRAETGPVAGSSTMHWLLIYTSIGWAIRLVMILVVLRRSLAPGASTAWLAIVFLHPYIGLGLYITFGETRLGPGRIDHFHQLLTRYAVSDTHAQLPTGTPVGTASLARLATKVGRMPVVLGNQIEFFTDSPVTVARLAADIDAAASHVHLLYYILADDSTGQRIAAALTGAAARGVKCRVLLDAFASRKTLRRRGLADRMRAAGVEVAAALPSSPLRRRDLRNHRKLAVIDDRVAFVGSMNLTSPDYGGKRGGPWIDLSGRYTGPIVAELASLFAFDWAFETDQELPAPSPADIAPVEAGFPMQPVPTGPADAGESFRRLFIGAIDAAEQTLILTTPYFIPDEATLVALEAAADRGVQVSLIVPRQSDNLFTAAAGRSHYARLLSAGISIYLFHPGLIHAKLVTIDRSAAVFGSANFDVRSFHLNFELSTLLYGRDAVDRLHAIQQTYMSSSDRLGAGAWSARPISLRYLDAAVALISPLL